MAQMRRALAFNTDGIENMRSEGYHLVDGLRLEVKVNCIVLVTDLPGEGERSLKQREQLEGNTPVGQQSLETQETNRDGTPFLEYKISDPTVDR